MAHAEEVDWTSVEAELVEDDGEAVRAHLAAGRAIPYREEDTPAGHVIRLSPDGRRDLVRVDRDGDAVVGTLPPR